MITTLTKKRVIRDFDKLDKRLRKKVLKSLPYGLSGDAITYLNIQGKTIAAIPFETEDTYYLFRLPSPKPPARKKRQFKEDYDSAEDMDYGVNYYEKSEDDEQVGYDYHHSDDYDQEEDSDF